jgi:hypothetical protein
MPAGVNFISLSAPTYPINITLFNIMCTVERTGTVRSEQPENLAGLHTEIKPVERSLNPVAPEPQSIVFRQLDGFKGQHAQRTVLGRLRPSCGTVACRHHGPRTNIPDDHNSREV